MRKLILCIFILINLNYQIKAQIAMMPKMGIVFTDVNLKTNDSTDIKGRLGFMAGLAVNIKVSDLFSVQPEIVYIQKGLKTEYKNELNQSLVDNIRIDYLEIPILAKFSVGDQHKRGYFNLGPQVSIGLGGQRKLKNNFTNQEYYGTTSFGKTPINYSGTGIFFDNRIDYGIQAGGGFGVKVGNGLLTLDFRYSLGLGNLFDANDGQSKSDIKSKNRMFATNLAYFITLGE